MVKIGIITGSIRKNRVNTQITDWIMKNVGGQVEEAEFEVIDIKDFNLPLFEGSVSPAALNRQYEYPEAVKFSKKIDEMDGFIFVIPEYNRSYPGAFKNAMDHIAPEFFGKAAAIVSYGGNGGLASQVALRSLLSVLDVFAISRNITFSIYTEFTDGKFTPREGSEDAVRDMAKILIRKSEALKKMRDKKNS